MNFAELMISDRRLVLLRLLADAPGGRANTYVLASGLRAMGHDCSQAQVDADATWLQEVGCVKVEEIDSVHVVQLRSHGSDVAHGRATVPGVKRPVPGE